ncbi:TraI/MobA(P) family conjugative relaxase [Kiloniella laminariae]|uniref:TraI/MobA(P) family conjugative relaxase n=1 Tax=Kiloniella laminariae TaxID=454162 RepID=UPI000376D3D7|nr:TraI/MobA(P) family conjugative relaxase [Kiloniella laminariae]
MISKRVERRSQDNFGRLAEYLAAAKEKGEKLDDLWIVGSDAGTTIEDLDLAIMDIEATQALNTRAKTDKTYHLIVSFRNDKPSAEALRDIEENFAKALGFEEHQRVAATHINTDNFHMHVAYNKIHPKTLRCHTPSWDFPKREKICREMEKKYGLSIDNGIPDKENKKQISTRSRDYEAITWEQSFDGYVRDNKKGLKAVLEQSKGWQDLHKGFADFGVQLKLRGNGLVITTQDRKTGIKASAIDRAFSKGSLEKKLGRFEKPIAEIKQIKPSSTYRKKPITSHPKQDKYWNRYLGKKRGKDSLALKMYKNWREFLALEAMSDPMAMAIIIYHKKLLQIPEKVVAQFKPKDRKDRGRSL